MENKIFLESKKSKYSVNKEENLSINLSSKSRILPYNDVTTNFNLYNLYNEERDNSDSYRIILTVNPICSNVLFNNKSEFVRHEGSSATTVLLGNNRVNPDNVINTTPVDNKQAIRDTEYTSIYEWDDEQPLVYHCGLDILNNHLLRQDDFINVSITKTEHKDVFNTVYDYVRNFSGETRKESTGVDTTLTPIHLYQYDTLLTMYNAFANRIKEENGWYGFKNSTNMDISNAKLNKIDVSLNKVMNNNKSCEMIDFYPDRSLYSFIPKLNKYRHRVERNWDYCLTYPYKNESIQKICQSDITGTTESSVRIIKAEVYNSISGFECVRMKTMFRHTLKSNDYITLFYKLNGTLQKWPLRLKIYSIGDIEGQNKNRYFSIKMSDIETVFANDNGEVVFRDENYKPTSEKAQFFYKKNIGGYDCQYYFRIFKKIECNSEINKLSYGENIYGDRMAQIVFTDIVDTSTLLDNNGRPVSEIYLTVIKRNQGHKEWYEDNDFNNDKIEFSHCFGKVTSGMDMPVDDDCYDYNVRRQHNVNLTAISDTYRTETQNIFSTVLNKQIKVLEDDITINNDEFYGDIVESDITTVKETVIEPVYYRFNTAQRETVNSDYFDILYDRLDSDDYDQEGFKITSGYLNTMKYGELPTGHTADDKLFAGNICPEGYYYNPHFKIQVKQISDNITQVSGKTLNYRYGEAMLEVRDGETVTAATIELTSLQKLTKYDIVGLYDNGKKEVIWGQIFDFYDTINGTVVKIWLCGNVDKDYVDSALKSRTYTLIVTDNGIAPYANYLPDSHTFVWRNLVPMSSLVSGDKLYDMPFTNGCHYVNQNINLFLKRQDPRNEYFLLSSEEASGKYTQLKNYKIWGWDTVDISTSTYNDLTEFCV